MIERLKAARPAEREIVEREAAIVIGLAISIVCRLLPPFVSKELRLPYPWLAVQLSHVFTTRIANEAAGPGTFRLAVGVIAPTSAARGRRPKHGGDSIKRKVEWFYRAHVQEPTESIRKLATEYSRVAPELGLTALQSKNRKSDARSVVQDAITRARALLDQAEYFYAPLPE